MTEQHEDGEITNVRETLWLLGAYGDSPFRAKLAMWLGHAAYFGCGYCCFEGTYVDHAMRFEGYCMKHLFQFSNREPAYAGHSSNKLTHEEHIARGRLAAENKLANMHDPQLDQCDGLSIFAEKLSYIMYPPSRYVQCLVVVTQGCEALLCCRP